MDHRPTITRRPGRFIGPAGAVVAILALLLTGCGEAEERSTTSTVDATSSTSSTTTVVTQETTAAPSTSVAGGEDDDVAEGRGGSEARPIWPSGGSATTYEDPVSLVSAFAREYLGFTRLVVGDFDGGPGASSGSVPIRSFEGGTPTMVSVTRLGTDAGWSVLGATNEHLIVESPAAASTVSPPVTVSGRSTAFEGTIEIEIREEGRMDPLGAGFATGGANGEMGPFTTSIDLAEGGADRGVLIVRTVSMEDGGTQEATVIGISFA